MFYSLAPALKQTSESLKTSSPEGSPDLTRKRNQLDDDDDDDDKNVSDFDEESGVIPTRYIVFGIDCKQSISKEHANEHELLLYSIQVGSQLL